MANLVGFSEVGLDDVMDSLMSDHVVLSNEYLILGKKSEEEEGSEDRSCAYADRYRDVQSCAYADRYSYLVQLLQFVTV